MAYFEANLRALNSISAVASSQTPLGEFTALPRLSLAGFQGPTSKGRRREDIGDGRGGERKKWE